MYLLVEQIPQTKADAERPLVVHWCAVITRQIVPDTLAALVRALVVDLLHQSGQPPVFHCAGAGSAGTPLVIAGTGDMQRTARLCHGILLFLRGTTHRLILTLLTKLSR